jgi:phage shock protein A
MSIFSRLFKIGQASANKVVEKFEKPELMLEQAIADKEKQIREMKPPSVKRRHNSKRKKPKNSNGNKRRKLPCAPAAKISR